MEPLLKEYRCRACGKLLCKGLLHHSASVVEVKCRKCGGVCKFFGQDAEIITQRSILIRQRLIPDTDSPNPQQDNLLRSPRSSMLKVAFYFALCSCSALYIVSQYSDLLS